MFMPPPFRSRILSTTITGRTSPRTVLIRIEPARAVDRNRHPLLRRGGLVLRVDNVMDGIGELVGQFRPEPRTLIPFHADDFV